MYNLINLVEIFSIFCILLFSSSINLFINVSYFSHPTLFHFIFSFVPVIIEIIFFRKKMVLTPAFLLILSPATNKKKKKS